MHPQDRRNAIDRLERRCEYMPWGIVMRGDWERGPGAVPYEATARACSVVDQLRSGEISRKTAIGALSRDRGL
jgi:hypothetical protein